MNENRDNDIPKVVWRHGVLLREPYLVVLNAKGQRHATAFPRPDTVAVISRHLTREDAARAVGVLAS